MAGSGTRFMFRSAFFIACGITIGLVASDGSAVATRVVMARSPQLAPPAAQTLGLTAEAIDPLVAQRLRTPAAVNAAVITSLAAGGPAARAGIGIGDIAVAINGLPINNQLGLTALLVHRGPARLEMLRHGVTRRVNVG